MLAHTEGLSLHIPQPACNEQRHRTPSGPNTSLKTNECPEESFLSTSNEGFLSSASARLDGLWPWVQVAKALCQQKAMAAMNILSGFSIPISLIAILAIDPHTIRISSVITTVIVVSSQLGRFPYIRDSLLRVLVFPACRSKKFKLHQASKCKSPSWGSHGDFSSDMPAQRLRFSALEDFTALQNLHRP